MIRAENPLLGRHLSAAHRLFPMIGAPLSRLFARSREISCGTALAPSQPIMRLDSTGLMLAIAVELARLLAAPVPVVDVFALFFLSQMVRSLSGPRFVHLCMPDLPPDAEQPLTAYQTSRRTLAPPQVRVTLAA